MMNPDYAAYLASKHWQRTCDWMRGLASECCEFCGAGEFVWDDEYEDYRCTTVHVHHITYENIGKEKSFDLLVLCRECHRDAHEFPQRKEHMVRYCLRRRAQQGFLRPDEAELQIERLVPAKQFPTTFVIDESLV